MSESPQQKIEEFMSDVINRGNYEMVCLFSHEGLPIAEAKGTGIVSEDRLIELSILFKQIVQMADVMGGISQLREIVIEGNNRRKIVFRFFESFNQLMILALVVPPKKSYLGLTNKLMKLIETL
jgi:hypothetical protein